MNLLDPNSLAGFKWFLRQEVGPVVQNPPNRDVYYIMSLPIICENINVITPLTLLLIQCGDKRYIFYTDWN